MNSLQKESLQEPNRRCGPSNVWSIKGKLQAEAKSRDLAMFNLAIDSKLRACDIVALKVEDIASNGYAADRATIRQKKTGLPVRFEITEQTRQVVDEYLRGSGKKSGQIMFNGRRGRILIIHGHAPLCERGHHGILRLPSITLTLRLANPCSNGAGS